jgi:hypothetical protein
MLRVAPHYNAPPPKLYRAGEGENYNNAGTKYLTELKCRHRLRPAEDIFSVGIR